MDDQFKNAEKEFQQLRDEFNRKRLSEPDFKKKLTYYKRIKVFLRDSSTNYQRGGFKEDAQWVLATSAYFDGIWQLIESDREINLSKKDQVLNIATNFLTSALEIFEQAGYEQKKEEILNYLEKLKNRVYYS